jgi:hypothetical protein
VRTSIFNYIKIMAPRHKKTLTKIEQIADQFTIWIGSPSSIVVHTIVFVAAFGFVLIRGRVKHCIVSFNHSCFFGSNLSCTFYSDDS